MRGARVPLPQYAFMAWCSYKKAQRDNFTLTLNYLKFFSKYTDSSIQSDREVGQRGNIDRPDCSERQQ